MLRLFLILSGLFLLNARSSAQNHYVLDGITVIYCNPDTIRYLIDTDADLDLTLWTIDPSPGAVFHGTSTYEATLSFHQTGLYTLTSTSYTVSEELKDTLYILVQLQTEPPDVMGCYELSPGNDCYKVCAHSTNTVYVQNPNSEWEIIGAESWYYVDQQTIRVTWGDAGAGKVISHGPCFTELCFEILPKPTADFITDPATTSDTLIVCKGQEIQFSNTSFNGLTYHWNFGDGQQSTDFHTSHSFANEGDYEVTLAAESICECKDEKKIIIRVLPEPSPTLDCVNSVCPETRQVYTAASDGCTTYSWSVSSNGTVVNGGTSTDDFIEIIWHEGPDGFIELELANCNTTYCVSSSTFRIPIVSPDGPIEGDASVCSGEIVNYSAPYFNGTVYNWQIGPGGVITDGGESNVITVQWNDVNAVTSSFVSVEYDNCFLGCGGQASMNVSITPEVSMLVDEQVCQGQSASASAEAGFISPLPANVNWHIENALGENIYSQSGTSSSFTHLFNYTPGIYYWVATNTSLAYCTELLRKRIVVTQNPDPPLSIQGETTICPGIPYGFSITPAGNLTTHWVIQDGINTFLYKGEHCEHAFGSTLPYTVSAYHADIQYPDCISSSISISLNTIASYIIEGPAEVCHQDITSFDAPYVIGANYNWEIIPPGLGAIQRNDQNKIDIFWTQPGSATLRLTACGTVLDKPIIIHALPGFNLAGPMAACENEKVTLSTDVPALMHKWFNEGGGLTGNSDTIDLYPGVYSVEVKDNFGCVSEKSFIVNSFPAPVVHISTPWFTTFCSTIPGGVKIYANTDGAGYTFNWFRDGNPVAGASPVYNVTDFGSYHVEVVNEYGCRNISGDITFYDCCSSTCGGPFDGPPLIPGGCDSYILYDFDLDKVNPECGIRTITTNDPAVTPGQTGWLIESASEGIIANLQQDVLNYQYQYPGYYFIWIVNKLTGFPYAPEFCGHFQLIRDTVLAVANFEHIGKCVNAPIEFEDLTTFLPGESIASWQWDFGDPASGVDNTSTLQDPAHTFANKGDYQVKLTVQLASGCFTTFTKTIHISGGPELMPVFDPGYCEDEAMAFSLAGNVFDIEWNFDDPASGINNTANGSSVFHTYAIPSVYTALVSAADIHGCISDTSLSAEIHANTMSGLITISPAGKICAGDTATLNAPLIGTHYTWNTGETTAEIKTTESNQFDVWIENEFGCTYSPPSVLVDITPRADLIVKAREILGTDTYGPWQDSLQICAGTEFQIEAFSSSGTVFYEWIGLGITKVISFTEEGGNLPSPGIYEFHAFARPFPGCISDTLPITIEIFELPVKPHIGLSGTGCSFNDNVLQVDNIESGIEYTWSDGQQGPLIHVEDAGSYSVTAINQNGCIEHSNPKDIKPAAPVDQIPGGCHLKCDPLQVCLPDIENVVSWNIYQNGTLFQSGTAWPSDFTIDTDGSYVIEVTTINGCTALSDPLDIQLYTGVGSITVLTYLDVDHDGMITSADLLLPGIPVEITSHDGLHSGTTLTESNGAFVFEDYPATNYLANFNLDLLSSQYIIVIDSLNATIATCDDSVVVSLLLEENCVVTGPDLTFESCPGEEVIVGDSIWSDTGDYELHLLSVSGCDSLVNVHIVRPDSFLLNATVWIDVDQNGVVSPADTVMEGITIMVDEGIGHLPDTYLTDENGSIHEYYHAWSYLVSVDSTILPSWLSVVYGAAYVTDTVCGEANVHFLLISNCSDIFLVQQEALCAGDSVFVENQWLSGTGVYSFSLNTPGEGCDTTLDVYLSELPAPLLTGQTGWNCIDLGSISLNVFGTPPFTYSWSGSSSSDSTLLNLPDGSYSIIVTDSFGCSTNDTFYIQGVPPLHFEVDPVFEIEAGDSVLISIEGDTSVPGVLYQWNPSLYLSCDNCYQLYAFPDSGTLLTVEIMDTNGCQYLLEVFIDVRQDTTEEISDQLYVPNVFSPNGDGINDSWKMYSRLANTQVMELTIFDRWGTLILVKEDFDLATWQGWDGMFKGEMYNPGVFAYRAHLILGDGQKVFVKGDITLIR